MTNERLLQISQYTKDPVPDTDALIHGLEECLEYIIQVDDFNDSVISKLATATLEIERLTLKVQRLEQESDKNYKGYKFKP